MVARWCRISQPPSTGGSPTSSQDDFILLGLSKRVPRLANLVERSDAMALWPRGSGDGGWWMDVASRFLGGQCVYIYNNDNCNNTIQCYIYIYTVYVYTYMYLYVLVCICMHLYVLICTYMYLHLLKCTHIDLYVLVCTYMYSCIFMYGASKQEFENNNNWCCYVGCVYIYIHPCKILYTYLGLV